ncbi:response regulator [Spirosoma sp. KUDC1026]|uniref:response regulator n=1 Tax=Spirosoma sp. KUDC1026 TaxID=2745947 RepID=UPI00159BC6D7|nr:response regulator [Spirosoma sp. KUDC1026]QKZ14393.1 response regulator [Spirosoma sp. KUDC1026]
MSLNGPILCIDDDDDDQYLIRQALTQLALPNQIISLTDGQQALDFLLATQERPFLILCDINMPLLNGLELRRKVNASDYLRKKSIPFVFLTTTASEYSVEEAYRESVQGFYQKATTYEALQRQIRLIVEYWQSCLHPNRRLWSGQ